MVCDGCIVYCRQPTNCGGGKPLTCLSAWFDTTTAGEIVAGVLCYRWSVVAGIFVTGVVPLTLLCQWCVVSVALSLIPRCQCLVGGVLPPVVWCEVFCFVTNTSSSVVWCEVFCFVTNTCHQSCGVRCFALSLIPATSRVV